MKFPSTIEDIVTIHIDQKVARECYVVSLNMEPTRRLYSASPHDRSRERRERLAENRSRSKAKKYMVALVDIDPRLDDARMEAGEDLQPLPLSDDGHKTYIGILVSRTLMVKGQPPPRRTLVKSYGVVELEDSMSHKSWVVNGQRLKAYLNGEIKRLITMILLKEL